jgi:hypothetical protein
MLVGAISAEHHDGGGGAPEPFALGRAAHAQCGVAVQIERGASYLVCGCERCKDMRAHEFEKGRPSSPAAWGRASAAGSSGEN